MGSDRIESPPLTAPLQLNPLTAPTPVVLGIDVVDLGNPRTSGKASDDRFVQRVCSTDEADNLRADQDPELDLWCRWAAKEAAFKVVSKVRGAPPSFVHRAFETDWHDEAIAPEDGMEALVRSGYVHYDGAHVPVVVRRSGAALHSVAFCVGLEGGLIRRRVAELEAPGERWSSPLEELESLFTERELDAIHSYASAAVRLAARGDLAGSLGISEDRLEIVCPPGPTGLRPPHVLLDGEPTRRADVSLSHDGPWIAWAIWVDGETGSDSGTETG